MQPETQAHEKRARMAWQQAGGPRVDLMQRGEIWLVGLDPAEGHEQRGVRPVLIVSPGAFNRTTKVPVVLPITSGGGFVRSTGFAVNLSGSGTSTTGVVRCDQARALDLRARGGRRLETVPGAVMDEVLARLAHA
ncbi:MAG TPA: type II toxin-antitoxin system PemK/MazF family toxin [Candidatus Sulfopaludibacter sp.]|nr:type II toxin-antitoxin system PemK/MazF family toxin [Candidatus Sulfopaludibacter sp.]